jgi:hypothetical protein
MRRSPGQSSFNDADVEGQTPAQLPSEARAFIGAIVGEYDDAHQPRRDRPAKTISLAGESPQASRQAFFFVSDGNGDHEAWPDGRDETYHWLPEAGYPCAVWVVKHRHS